MIYPAWQNYHRPYTHLLLCLAQPQLPTQDKVFIQSGILAHMRENKMREIGVFVEGVSNFNRLGIPR